MLNNKAFLWEGSRFHNGYDQMLILVVFAETKEEALKLFLEKESDKSKTREAFAELTEWTEPVELSPALTEINKTLLFHSQCTEDFTHVHDTREGHSSRKLYRYTPGRIIYILAKIQHTKEKEKANEVTFSLDDMDL